jgi:hypothetical protein
MGYFKLDEKNVARLHELADLQHPHLKGKNHTRSLIDKISSGEQLSVEEAFDCGKYYQRMLNQLSEFDDSTEIYSEYLHAILAFKWSVKTKL